MGGLHHACGVVLVAVETEKKIGGAVVPESRLTGALVTEEVFLCECVQAVNNARWAEPVCTRLVFSFR